METNLLQRYPLAHRLPTLTKAKIIAEVRAALNTRPDAVEKAIKILYTRQTASEKMARTTHVDNQLGVKHQHGARIVYYGKWLESGRHLTGHHLEFARRMAQNYAATQLFELAAVKAGLLG